MEHTTSLVGQGLAFPPKLGPDGRLAWSSGSENIRECIRIVLTTDPGERVMLPAFGAGLRSFLYQPNVPATHRLIEERVARALTRWEPRVKVESVSVAANPVDARQADVTVCYSLVATGEQGRVSVAAIVGGRP